MTKRMILQKFSIHPLYNSNELTDIERYSMNNKQKCISCVYFINTVNSAPDYGLRWVKLMYNKITTLRFQEM